jgi:hypothetical protein
MQKDKLTALKEANTIISRKIKTLDVCLNGSNDIKVEELFQSSNTETSINIYSIKGGQKSKIYVENEFQRIICVGGKIKIVLPKHNEDIILTSPNTVLIPPLTEYKIESIENSEIIVIFKPKKGEEEKIMVANTIYNKQYRYE